MQLERSAFQGTLFASNRKARDSNYSHTYRRVDRLLCATANKPESEMSGSSEKGRMSESSIDESTRTTHEVQQAVMDEVSKERKNRVSKWFTKTWNLNYGGITRPIGTDWLSRKDPYAICCMLTTATNYKNDSVLAHAASRLDELYKTKIFCAVAYEALCGLIAHPNNKFSPRQNMIAIARWCRWIPGRRFLAPSLGKLVRDKGLNIRQCVAVGVIEMRYRDLFVQ